jgi:hypothetical protein
MISEWRAGVWGDQRKKRVFRERERERERERDERMKTHE